MGDGGEKAVRFVLDVDLPKLSGETVDELARILRYWAGNLKHYDLDAGVVETVRDSEYREVGQWSLS
ncbi:hypothetical protein MF406_15220 [Georgenia sp. TF02-10]|uniref:hypothetical protein n=1 Tax=Georgenia sp. TF02-10 TaxID=2917725 RepID=UPI001FA77EF4|nr:hypothetical protein [Georgenia sp. TF02-10]UNX54259.1 hypothetical protein MF406_15220 [Georgenia sp. TF02-10]